MKITRQFKYFIGLLSLLLIASCAPKKQSQNFNRTESENIIGGQDQSRTKKTNYSVAAILLTNANGNLEICTGTFITKKILITAAHCVSNDTNDMTIKIGNSIFDEKKSITLTVAKIFKHPLYKVGKNDLALVEINYDDSVVIVPVAVAKSNEELINKSFYLFGYGVNQTNETEDGLQGAGVLRKLNMNGEFFFKVKDQIIIHQSRSKGACHGDSGGPAFVFLKNRYVLAGVASGVVQNDDEVECSKNSVYTPVADHLNWIESTLKNKF